VSQRTSSAALYGVASKTISGLNWLVAATLVSTHLSRARQGYFFTFLSFATMQVLFELGLATAIIQFVAHEWVAVAGGGEEAGRAASRLRGVARFVIRWYAGAAVALFVVLQLVGYDFFGRSTPESVWLWPWILLTASVAGDLVMVGLWSIIEGCNRIESVYRFRAARALALGLVTWCSLLGGLGLYSLGLAYLLSLPVSVALLRGENWALIRSILAVRETTAIPWKKEILPLQWRLAVSFASGYFAQWGITPITFKLFGPTIAGQFGMIWAIINALAAVSGVIMTVHAPRFGALIALRRYAELDRVARRATLISLGIGFVGTAGVVGLLYLVTRWNLPLVDRVLPLKESIIMLAGFALGQVINPLAVYLRSHKREPYLWLSIVYAATLVLATILGGRAFGAQGVALSYLFISALILTPAGIWIFIRCRRSWHAEPVSASP
jgi:O-antigen/teichoic acid export membrane protein